MAELYVGLLYNNTLLNDVRVYLDGEDELCSHATHRTKENAADHQWLGNVAMTTACSGDTYVEKNKNFECVLFVRIYVVFITDVGPQFQACNQVDLSAGRQSQRRGGKGGGSVRPRGERRRFHGSRLVIPSEQPGGIFDDFFIAIILSNIINAAINTREKRGGPRRDIKMNERGH